MIQASLQKEQNTECNQITNLLKVTVNRFGETLISQSLYTEIMNTTLTTKTTGKFHKNNCISIFFNVLLAPSSGLSVFYLEKEYFFFFIFFLYRSLKLEQWNVFCGQKHEYIRRRESKWSQRDGVRNRRHFPILLTICCTVTICANTVYEWKIQFDGKKIK